jgi:hypothetical protein
MKGIFLIIVFALGMFWMSCKEAQPLEGSTSYSSELKFDTLYAVRDTFLVKGRISTAGSPKLLLGNYNGFQTRFLLHFQTLPDDTLEVDSLYLRLQSWSNYGLAGEPIRGRIFLINEEWPESINETGEVATTPLEVEPFYITTDSISYRIDLPPALLDVWRDTTGGNHNYGLMIDAESADFIKEFYSGNTTYAPELIWTSRYALSDSIIRDTTFTTLDASLIDFGDELDPQALYVTSGYLVHAFIKFDFSQLPKNINIVYVNFAFTNHDTYSAINENKSQSFYLKNVLTSFENLSYTDEIIFDQTVAEDLFQLTDEEGQLLTRDDQQMIKKDYGRYYIQDILNGTVAHNSFMLAYANQNNDASVYAIKRTHSGKDAPQVIVGYNTLIPPRLQ